MEESKIYQIIFNSIEEVNKNLESSEKININKDTYLIGPNSSIDSMGFAILINSIETNLLNDLNLDIDLLEISSKRDDFFYIFESPRNIVNFLKGFTWNVFYSKIFAYR